MSDHRCPVCREPVSEPGKCDACRRADDKVTETVARQLQELAKARERGRGRKKK